MSDSRIFNLVSQIWGWLRRLTIWIGAWLRRIGSRSQALIGSFPGRIIAMLKWFRVRAAAFLRKSVWWYAKRGLIGLAVVALLVSIAMFALVHYPTTQIPEYEPVDEIVYLGQGWGTGRDSLPRRTFYYTSQGTTLFNLRYSWFVNLEMPWGKERFASSANMERYGFVVDPVTKMNPDQLPVGFSRHYDVSLGDELLDISCAACHTGQLNRTLPSGKRIGIRIDGGQAMHAFTTTSLSHFLPVLIASMASTYLNPLKFDRFAHKVLAESNFQGRVKLRKEFWKVLAAFVAQGVSDHWKQLYPVEEGFGRTDAVGRIANRTFGDRLDPANYRVGNAPVNYPPLWEIWKFDWVQYGASVAQPMARNGGETLGVGARYRLVDDYGRPLPPKARFSTSTRIHHLDDLEKTLWELQPPKWPEELLGKIDKKKAEQGKQLFEKHCRHCHGPHQASPPLRAWQAPLKDPKYLDRYPDYKDQYASGFPQWWVRILPIYDIGTDPNAALNFVNHRFDLTRTGLTNDDVQNLLRHDLKLHQKRKKHYLELEISRLESLRKSCLQEDAVNCVIHSPDTFQDVAKSAKKDLKEAQKCLAREIENPNAWGDDYLNQVDVSAASTGQGLLIAGRLMRKKYFEEHRTQKKEQDRLNGFGILDLPEIRLAYKSRPLAGMWATPPFLHNGSVPNLYQLLSPVDERDTGFFVGSRDFDPVSVGYELSDTGFWFDTTIEGNANTGHEFRDGHVEWQPGAPPQYGVIGPELTPDERWALVEYLKVHRDEPRVEFMPCN